MIRAFRSVRKLTVLPLRIVSVDPNSYSPLCSRLTLWGAVELFVKKISINPGFADTVF